MSTFQTSLLQVCMTFCIQTIDRFISIATIVAYADVVHVLSIVLHGFKV